MSKENEVSLMEMQCLTYGRTWELIRIVERRVEQRSLFFAHLFDTEGVVALSGRYTLEFHWQLVTGSMKWKGVAVATGDVVAAKVGEVAERQYSNRC